ncbi:MAG: adenylosuccinate synthetase [Solirubrobacterales bacterium]
MPVTVVVGGQYGSEGKGKVAQLLAEQRKAIAVVRVGGPNSGHTGMSANGDPVVLRQLPTVSLIPDTICVIGAGSYIDPHLLLAEIKETNLGSRRLIIDPNAMVITDEDRKQEATSDLGSRIGSTCSGTGAAVAKRMARRGQHDLASSVPALAPYIGDASSVLREILLGDGEVIVEGTQGFGLSALHSPHFPYVTTRDTTAAGALSEAGLSPLDVEDVVLVLRSFPIRVAGNSGDFGAEEMSWETLGAEGGHTKDLREYTSVTQRVRRVARFDPKIVRRAIIVNKPSLIVLNHVDYLDATASDTILTKKCRQFVDCVSHQIGQPVDLVGLSPKTLVTYSKIEALAA